MTPLTPTNSPQPETSPEPVQKFHFLRANKRPILSFGSAIVVGYFAAPFFFKAPVTETVLPSTLPTETGILIPASSVMTLRSTPAASIPITGQVKLVANVTGKAPVGGAVARWLVEPGQKVQKGQGVVEISTGRAIRPAPAAEASQTLAEKQQINAANDQLELAQKLSTAQSQLRAAKERVANAQEKVGEARQLIKRLQNGETVTAQPTRTRKRIVKRTVTPAQPADASPSAPSADEIKAQAALKTAQRNADAAQTSQRQAEAAAKGAERAFASSKAAAKDAEKRLTLTEAAFDDGKVSGADVHESRIAVDDANVAVKAAESMLDPTKREADAQKKNAAAALAQLDDAKKALDAAKSQNKTRVAVAPTPEIVEEVVEEVIPDSTSSEPASAISIIDASKMAQAALAESKAAAREADRLTSQVESYRRQAHSSNTEIEQASQGLMRAQQRVLDSVPRPQFTVCEAPNSGTIVWISRMASEVGVGDSVFGVAANQRFKALMQVDTPVWKNIKIGQIVSGSLGKIKPQANLPMLAPSVGGATYSPVVSKEVSLNIKVTKVTPPTAPDTSAEVEGDIEVISGTSSSLDAGKVLAVSLPSDQKTNILSVPEGAVQTVSGKSYVAILSELPEPAATPAAVADENSGAAASGVKEIPTEPKGESYLLEWKPVEVGAKKGGVQEIRSGVQMGTRIVSNILSLLPQVDLDPKSTSIVTVSDI